MTSLNLDDFVSSIKTHSIVLNGKTYDANPLTLQQLVTIQELYANHSDNDSVEPLKVLLELVGYPVDEILDLPVQAILKLQEELFFSLTEVAKKKNKPPQKKG